jgi:hypothetical protein
MEQCLVQVIIEQRTIRAVALSHASTVTIDWYCHFELVGLPVGTFDLSILGKLLKVESGCYTIQAFTVVWRMGLEGKDS